MEEQKLIMEVKIISTELIKPSTPTPSDRKLFNLSLLDQTFPPITLPILLFYQRTSNSNTNKSSDNILTTLKNSLAETLSRFYPLAGRYQDEHTVSCNDDGVPFIHARVSCLLSDLLNSTHKIELVSKFLPSLKDYMLYGSRLISEVAPLVFKINVFECGGIVIGCLFFHKLLDGASISTFLNYWAAVASKRYADLVDPDFDATVLAFPPSLKLDNKDSDSKESQSAKMQKSSPNNDIPINVVLKSFKFTKSAIDKLRVMASSEELPNPTTFEAVVGFICHQASAVAQMRSAPDEEKEASRIVMSIVGNIRARISPPLPKQSMGNLTTTVHAWADKWDGLTGLATEIHAAVFKMKQKADDLVCNQEVDWDENVEEENTGHYKVTSWLKFGFNEVDFGFGKPSQIIPIGMVASVLRNRMFLIDYNDVNGGGVGIEAWLFWEEKEMHVLESNPQFFEYASPTK